MIEHSAVSHRCTRELVPLTSSSTSLSEAIEVSPGVVMVAVGEDVYHAEDQGMTTGDPSVYLLFKSRNGFLVGEKMEGIGLGKVPADQARAYPGWWRMAEYGPGAQRDSVRRITARQSAPETPRKPGLLARLWRFFLGGHK